MRLPHNDHWIGDPIQRNATNITSGIRLGMASLMASMPKVWCIQMSGGPKVEDEHRNQPTHRDVSGFETVGFSFRKNVPTLPKFNSSPLKSFPNPNRKPDRLKQPPCFKGELLNFEGYIFIFVLFVVSEVDVGSSFQRNFRKIKPFIFRIRCFTHQNLMIQLLQSCCFLLNCAQTLGTPLAKQTNLFTGGFPGDLSDAWKKGWSSKEPWKGFFFLS